MSDEPFRYSDGKITIGGTMEIDEFHLELTRDVAPVCYGDSVMPFVDTSSIGATMTFDGSSFERWLNSASAAPAEALYTVEMRYSLDPYARRAKGLRQRLRKLWDCFVDDVRFMLGRRRVTHLRVTIPDVRFTLP